MDTFKLGVKLVRLFSFLLTSPSQMIKFYRKIALLKILNKH